MVALQGGHDDEVGGSFLSENDLYIWEEGVDGKEYSGVATRGRNWKASVAIVLAYVFVGMYMWNVFISRSICSDILGCVS